MRSFFRRYSWKWPESLTVPISFQKKFKQHDRKLEHRAENIRQQQVTVRNAVKLSVWGDHLRYLLCICQVTYFWIHAGKRLRQAAIRGLKQLFHMWHYQIKKIIKKYQFSLHVLVNKKNWLQLFGSEQLSLTHSVFGIRLCKHKARTIWKYIPARQCFHLSKEKLLE